MSSTASKPSTKMCQIPLDKAARIVGGATPKTGEDAFWGGPIAWATPKDLSRLESRHLGVTARTITEEGLASCAAEVLPVGSVLFSSRAPIGLTAINTVPMATNQGFKSLVPKPDVCDAGYLYQWLRGNRSHLESLGNGATFKEVSKAVVSRIEIHLPHKNGKPDLDEQKRIAAILDKADAIRRKRKQALDSTDDFLRSVFLDMFGDPVTNPKGWEVVPFESIGTARLGKMLDKKTQFGQSMFPYLGNSNVRWGSFELEHLKQMNFDEEAQKEFELKDGDLLICEGGEVGRAAIWRGNRQKIFFQKALHRVRCDRRVTTPEFVQMFMWFMAHRGGLSGLKTSATIAHLTGVKLKQLPTPLPSLPLQERFSEFYKMQVSLAEKSGVLAAVSNQSFASLQQRAFRGEL